MWPEVRLVDHVRGFGNEEAEVEVPAIGGAAEFELAKGGIGAETEQLERWIEKTIERSERIADGVGDRDCNERVVVPVAELKRIAAGIGQKFGVGMLVQRPIVGGQTAAVAVQIKQLDARPIDDWRADFDDELGVAA